MGLPPPVHTWPKLNIFTRSYDTPERQFRFNLGHTSTRTLQNYQMNYV